MLTDEDITNFQALYKSELGKDISREEAHEKGLKLVTLMSAVYKPMTQEEYDAIETKRRETLPELLKHLNEE